jgi:hypothetical protein
MAPGAGLVEEFALVTFKSTGGEYHGRVIFKQDTTFILKTFVFLRPTDFFDF